MTWPRGDDGQIGGLEVIPLGFLLFVAMTLLVVNAWAVIDAKLAVDAAAREAARTYVEADPGVADAAAQQAGWDAVAGHGRSPEALDLDHDSGPYQRCRRVTFTARYTVPALSVPFIGGFGSAFSVGARHSEVIDPYAARPGLGPANQCR